MNRKHSCVCGHDWIAPVELAKSGETPNISGEKTAYCPECNRRAVESSAHLPRKIAITYEVFDEESTEAGDAKERGWDDEEGVSMEPDCDEDDAVRNAVQFLRGAGATEASSSCFDPHVWYTCYGEMHSRTGETTNRSYHLKNWTVAELQAIYNGVKKRSAEPEFKLIDGALYYEDVLMGELMDGRFMPSRALMEKPVKFQHKAEASWTRMVKR